jgi:hypothetical protein
MEPNVMRFAGPIALAALLLAACGGPDLPEPAMAAAPDTEAGCLAAGGDWTIRGRMQSPQCITTYADAGEVCTDDADCAGACILEQGPFPDAGQSAQGLCQRENRQYGCYAMVVEGRATPVLCVD